MCVTLARNNYTTNYLRAFYISPTRLMKKCRTTNLRANLLCKGGAKFADKETRSRVLARLRSTILPVGLTRAFFLRSFAQPVLTWVLSLCIIRSASCVSYRVFVFGTTAKRDIVTSRHLRSLQKYKFCLSSPLFSFFFFPFVSYRQLSSSYYMLMY